MLAGKRSIGVAPEVNFRECVTHILPIGTNKAAHSGFETQRRRHQKSQTGVSVALRKGLLSSKNILKNTYLLRLQITTKLRHQNPEISHYVLQETVCLSKSSVKSTSNLLSESNQIYHIAFIIFQTLSRSRSRANRDISNELYFFSFLPRILLDYKEIKTYQKTVNDLKWWYCNVNECNVSMCVCANHVQARVLWSLP